MRVPTFAMDFRRFNNIMLSAVRTVSGLLLVVMFIVIILGVVFRYILNSPLFWSEELARYVMFYMVLVGSSAGIREKRHPALSFVVDRLPANLRRGWDVVVDVLVAVVLVIVFQQGLLMAIEERIGMTAALRISFFWVYLALPIGAALMVLEIVAKYVTAPTETAGDADGVETGEGG